MSNDETPTEGTTSAWEPATPPPEGSDETLVHSEVADQTVSDQTTQTPAQPGAGRQTTSGRTRGLLAAGAAGLVIVGGAAGFGLGRTTADADGPTLVPAGQQVPGPQGYGFDGTRPDRGGRPFGDRDQAPGDGSRFPGSDQAPADGTAPEVPGDST